MAGNLQAYKLRGIVRDAGGRIIHARISFKGGIKALRAAIDGAQEVADAALQRYVQAYVPLLSGDLYRSVAEETHVGTGEIVVGTAYGHYQNFLSLPYKTEEAQERHSANPDRGPHFIERAIQDHGDDVIEEAQQYLNSLGVIE